MKNKNTSIGLTIQEWVDNFERLGWTTKVMTTLAEVADAPDATVNQRALACKFLCMLANDNIIPGTLPDGRHISVLVANACLSCLDGAPAIALAKPELLEKARANYGERIKAVEFTLANACPQLLSDQLDPSQLLGALAGNPSAQGAN